MRKKGPERSRKKKERTGGDKEAAEIYISDGGLCRPRASVPCVVGRYSHCVNSSSEKQNKWLPLNRCKEPGQLDPSERRPGERERDVGGGGGVVGR